jgi:hypothetical protein
MTSGDGADEEREQADADDQPRRQVREEPWQPMAKALLRPMIAPIFAPVIINAAMTSV